MNIAGKMPSQRNPKKLSGDYCHGRFGGIRDFVVVIKMLTLC